jgi:hypothetical protein
MAAADSFEISVSIYKISVLQPGVCEDILGSTRKHLTSINMKQRNSLNIEPALTLAFTKILPLIEVLACQN